MTLAPRRITPYNEALRVRSAWEVETVADLARLSVEIDRQAQMIGYINAFVLYTAAAVLALLISIFVTVRR